MNVGKPSQVICKITVSISIVILLFLSASYIYGIFVQKIIAHDASIFAEMTTTLLSPDKTLYVDFWDHKPPGIAFFTAPFVLVFGRTTFAIHMAGMTIVALLVSGIALLTQALFNKRNLAFAAGLLALYFGLLVIYPRILETVVLMTTMATWAFYFATVARGRATYLFASGFLFGAAVLAKQPIAFNLITLYSFVFFFSPPQKRIFSFIVTSLGGMTITALVVGWALLGGNFAELWLYSTVANVQFSLTTDGSWLSNAEDYFFKRDTIPTLFPLVTMSIISVAILHRKKLHRKEIWLLAFWVIVGIPGAILGRGLTLNYFYQIVPPLIILSVSAVIATQNWNEYVKTVLVSLFAFGVIFLPQTYLSEVSSYFIAPDEVAERYFKLVDYIESTTSEDDCILIWGQANFISYYSGRSSCAPPPHAGVLMLENAFGTEHNRVEFMEALLENPPVYFLENTSWAQFPMLEQYLNRYRREAITDVLGSFYRMDTSSWQDTNANFANLFTLIGFDFFYREMPICPGDDVVYATTWRVNQMPQLYYQMFLQLRDAETHQTIVGVDASPISDYPTQEWTTINEVILSDNIGLSIPETAPAGKYYLAMGFYETESFERLNILDESGDVMSSEVTLNTFTIEECAVER